VQLIDVRDLAEWVVDMIARSIVGVFNATGPAGMLTMGSVLDTCRTVSGRDVRFTWVKDSFLLKHAVEPWRQLPLWLPESDPETSGFFAFDIRKALEAA
jgi:2'-hydroxyisoflavone reductase